MVFLWQCFCAMTHPWSDRATVLKTVRGSCSTLIEISSSIFRGAADENYKRHVVQSATEIIAMTTLIEIIECLSHGLKGIHVALHTRNEGKP